MGVRMKKIKILTYGEFVYNLENPDTKEYVFFGFPIVGWAVSIAYYGFIMPIMYLSYKRKIFKQIKAGEIICQKS